MVKPDFSEWDNEIIFKSIDKEFLKQLYTEFIESNFDGIKVCQKMIGALVSLKEKESGETRERIKDLIHFEINEIKYLQEDILNDKKFLKGLSGR